MASERDGAGSKLAGFLRKNGFDAFTPAHNGAHKAAIAQDVETQWTTVENVVKDLVGAAEKQLTVVNDEIAAFSAKWPQMPSAESAEHGTWCAENTQICERFNAAHELYMKHVELRNDFEKLRADEMMRQSHNKNVGDCLEQRPEAHTMSDSDTLTSATSSSLHRFRRCPNCRCDGKCAESRLEDIELSDDEIEVNRLFGFDKCHPGDNVTCPTCRCVGCDASLRNYDDHRGKSASKAVNFIRSPAVIRAPTPAPVPRKPISSAHTGQVQEHEVRGNVGKHPLMVGSPPGRFSEQRMITISNLPAGIELRDVLVKVRAGKILWTAISSDDIPGGATAVVVVESSTTASGFAQWVHNDLQLFTFFDAHGKPLVAKLTLIPTPTYPWDAHTDAVVGQGVTRYISIKDCGMELVAALFGSLGWFQSPSLQRHSADRLVDSWIDQDGTAHFQFRNLLQADLLHRQVRWATRFQHLYPGTKFQPDPCAGSVYELFTAGNRESFHAPVDLLSELRSGKLAAAWQHSLNGGFRQLAGLTTVVKGLANSLHSRTSSHFDVDKDPSVSHEASKRRSNVALPLSPTRTQASKSDEPEKHLESQNQNPVGGIQYVPNPADSWMRRFHNAICLPEPSALPPVRRRRVPIPKLIDLQLSFNERCNLPPGTYEWTESEWWASEYAARVPRCQRPIGSNQARELSLLPLAAPLPPTTGASGDAPRPPPPSSAL